MKPFEILVYGLNETEMAQIMATTVTECIVYSTDIATDLIATVSDMIIISTDYILPKDLSMLLEFYGEIEHFSEMVIFIGEIDLPNALKGKIRIFANFEEMERTLKYLLIKTRQKRRKSENFSATLANAISILCSIKNLPGISTKELAEKLEMSPRSIQRYIETLRIAGEWIEYDPVKKGWKLSEGKSVLLGDF